MTKKTLEEKINCVKWSTLLFAIIYFLIGAWLKSDGPNFDSTKAYELIRDTLTITAAFLAPVAAFVLFSDWRREHKEKRYEELVFDILHQIDKTSKKIRRMINLVHQEFQENEHEMIEMFSNELIYLKQETMGELGLLYKNKEFFEGETFQSKANAFCNYQIEMLENLDQLFRSSVNLNNCRNSPTDPDDLNWALRFYQSSENSFLQKAEEYLKSFDKRLDLLRDIAKSCKI